MVDGVAPAGAPLFHRLRGRGPVVVLLNGVSMTLSAWESVATLLEGRYRVLRCDFRGQLRSPGPPPATLEGHARDLLALLDHLGLERVHLVGASFGAAVARRAVTLEPERALSLTCATAAAGRTATLERAARRWLAAARAVLAGGDPGAVFDAFEPWVYSPRYLEEHPRHRQVFRAQVATLPRRWFVGLATLLECVLADDERAVTRAPCPALVIAAGADRLVAVEEAAELATGLGAAFEIIPGAGHALAIEHPAACARACLGFLDRLGSR
ncbi:MAG: alpha/beta hydrolase [Acidobacteriota bacterium]|nr:alpha/beta hydrolase [Acidobacteriota bacterium]